MRPMGSVRLYPEQGQDSTTHRDWEINKRDEEVSFLSEILLQYQVNERGQKPSGLRLYDDGRMQRPSPENSLPGATDRLDQPRSLIWVEDRTLNPAQINSVKESIRACGFFGLPAKLLINYCKEDPPAAIWSITLDDFSHQVVVYDPRPKRSKEIDLLLEALEALLKPTV